MALTAPESNAEAKINIHNLADSLWKDSNYADTTQDLLGGNSFTGEKSIAQDRDTSPAEKAAQATRALDAATTELETLRAGDGSDENLAAIADMEAYVNYAGMVNTAIGKNVNSPNVQPEDVLGDEGLRNFQARRAQTDPDYVPSTAATLDTVNTVGQIQHDIDRTVTNAEEGTNVTAEESEYEAVTADDLNDTSEAPKLIRTAYQCYLLHSMQYYAQAHQNLINGEVKRKDSAYSYDAASQEIRSPGYYSSVIAGTRIFLVDDDNEENATTINNKLRYCPGDENFITIKNHEYAQLVPLLKIYKVFRNHEGREVNKIVEMSFDNKTSLEGITGETSVIPPVGAPDSMFVKGTGCGVKSFDWKILGTDPFTATRDIDATLKLTFQHFSELVKPREGREILEGDALAPYKYMDLIIQPDCRQAAPSASAPSATPNPASQPYNKVYAPECYEIRVDVGYADPGPESGLSEDLRNGICCQRRSLYLSLADHKFNTNKDGTFELIANFKGRLNSIMRDKKFNVLLPGGGMSATNQVEELEKAVLEEKNKPKKKQNKETIDQKEIELQRYMVQAKQWFYAGVLGRLNAAKWVHETKLTPEEFTAFINWQNDADATLPPPRGIKGDLSKITVGEGDISDVQVEVATGDLSDPESTGSDELEESVEETLKLLQSNVLEGDYTINFVYLGDLLAVLTDNVTGDLGILGQTYQTQHSVFGKTSIFGFTPWSSEGMETGGRQIDIKPSFKDIVNKFRVILGNIDVEFKGLAESFLINLAHIPISMDAFFGFMQKNVLSKNSTYYSYFDFVDDLLSELVTDLLGSQCFNGLTSQRMRSAASIVSAPGARDPMTAGLVEPLSANNKLFYATTPQFFKALHLQQVPEDTVPFELCQSILAPDTPYEYMVLYASSTKPPNLAGVYDEPGLRGDNVTDKKRGIQHFSYGMDRGLLKDASFSKADQEYLPEARFASEGNLIFNQLSNIYDASFNMLGNNLFAPGQYLYFDPIAMGVGEPWQYSDDGTGTRSWANIMGLGGYHLVTEVACSIKPGKFDTSVKARWVTGGEDGTA